MDKIIEEVKTYQSDLTKIDSSEYKKSCDTYNDNVEAGRLAKITNDELDSLQAYKNNPLDLEISFDATPSGQGNASKVSLKAQVAKIDGNKYRTLIRNLANSFSGLTNFRNIVVTKKDNGFTIPEKIKGKVKKSSSNSAIHERFFRAKSILDGRGFPTGRELDAKRDE